ncbi:Rz-like lysis system protein LysB [Motilimonas sp. 1_MG-2023]|nr:Rz-like lysis system protein LysB [Motilimonas sp. 1_MG-2023]MDO6525442.1 Rz-like lysis system protein LysB [Motilimonas sp. 1_MG-2023]
MQIKLFAILGVAALVLVLTAVTWGQHQTLVAERKMQVVLKATVTEQASVISVLETHALRNAQDSAELNKTLQQVQALASEGRQTWEKLKRENNDFKKWAESVLPADAIRLRQRPAITGADGYKSWLQQSNSLHPTSQPSDKK